MRILGWLLALLGLLVAMMGGLWTLQGLGIVMWPAESFMLAERKWALYGAIVLAVGALIVWLGLKLARRPRC